MDKIFIHPTSKAHPEAKIHPTVIIGPNCIIGKCEIGANSCVGAFTTIKDGSIIGKNVIIREYCLIGGCGFIFVRDSDGYLEQTPHISRAVLEDYVELSPYVNVDRGTVVETRIKKGTKIDHYSHIGHSSVIGEHCVVTASVIFCGESSLGDYSFVGVGAIIKPKVVVGRNCLIGMGSMVINDVPDGLVSYGNPAKNMRKNDRGYLKI